MFATTSKSTRLRDGIHPGSTRPTGKTNQGSGAISRKLTKERWQAIGILVLFGALMGLLLYLAAMSGMSYPGGNTGYEFWMMP